MERIGPLSPIEIVIGQQKATCTKTSQDQSAVDKRPGDIGEAQN
jgi:hypothetical protein